ncbi:hypothetical protein ACMYR3_03620 [Ampullimonas aquatilis]|uniref:hypothetical protein n=1 Tax=Ampullimonas aquatilis TaxID=1341549 RepID=UPI003C72BE5B
MWEINRGSPKHRLEKNVILREAAIKGYEPSEIILRRPNGAHPLPLDGMRTAKGAYLATACNQTSTAINKYNRIHPQIYFYGV